MKHFLRESATDLPLQYKKAISVFLQDARAFESGPVSIVVDQNTRSATMRYRGADLATVKGATLVIAEGNRNVEARAIVAHLQRRAATLHMDIDKPLVESHHRMWDGEGRDVAKPAMKGTLRYQDEPLEEGSRFRHLAGCGKVPARLAREVREGDVLSFEHQPNEFTVVDAQTVSARCIEFTLEDSSGKTHRVRRTKDSLMAVMRPKRA